MNMLHAATIRPNGDGKRIAVVGDIYRILATGAETGGTYAMIDATIPPGGGPPPHIHSREEESFYVLAGEVAFYLGEERIVGRVGDFLNMPIDSRHSFKNESEQPAQMLITVAPAGLEQMFLEVGQVLTSPDEQPAPIGEADIEKLLEAAPRYGVTILPPPH